LIEDKWNSDSGSFTLKQSTKSFKIKIVFDSLTDGLHIGTSLSLAFIATLCFDLRCRSSLSLWIRTHQALDCSPTNRERELVLDRFETGQFYPSDEVLLRQ